MVVVILVGLGITKPIALIAVGISATVAVGVFREWYRGTRARHRIGESYPVAFVRLILANRPRYGGYVVHLAIVMMALAIVGTYFFETQRDVRLAEGETAEVSGYAITYLNTERYDFADRTQRIANVEIFDQDGESLGIFRPEQSFYPTFSLRPARAAIRSTPLEDIYVIPNDFFPDGTVGFRILVNPLVMWMWVAGPIVVVGTLIALWPERRPVRATARSLQHPGTEYSRACGGLRRPRPW